LKRLPLPALHRVEQNQCVRSRWTSPRQSPRQFYSSPPPAVNSSPSLSAHEQTVKGVQAVMKFAKVT
jgi:hypothetical protein